MSLVADTILPSRKERSWALWTAAAVVIVAAHALLGLYVLFVRDNDDYGAKTPDAIIIDLAPIAAPPAEEKIAPPVEKSEPPPAPKPVPDPAPEPQKLEPLPELQTPTPPEVRAEMTLPAPLPEPQQLEPLPLLQTPPLPPEVKPEVTLPEPVKPPPKEAIKKELPKPQPKPDVRPTRQEIQERQEREQQRRAQQQQQRQQTAARSQAQPTPSPAASAMSLANWKGELVAHIRRFQRYPEAARSRSEAGTASVSFTLDRSGRVVSARLASSSGSATLDQEAVATVQRASPMPAPPNGSSVSINVPLRYSLR